MKRKLKDFGYLTPAEQTLRDELWKGESVIIGDGARPGPEAGEERQIRAEFLRCFILGDFERENPDDPTLRVPENGVRVMGARITGRLDLEGARIPRDIGLIQCHLEEAPLLLSALLDTLFLHGSALPGLLGDGLAARGAVMLRGAEVTGAVRLLGAKLGGNLACDGARLTAGEGGNALHADGLEAKGGVFLRGATTDGDVRFAGARLGGDLDCTGARLTAGESGAALVLQKVEISGCFVVWDLKALSGGLVLTAAKIGELVDDARSWPEPGKLILDRCDYGAFTGGAPVTAEARKRWLGLKGGAYPDGAFYPQPWEHCAKVLREMGHGAEARAILIDKERRQRADRVRRLRAAHLYEDAYWFGFWDWIVKWMVVYGRQPFRAFMWLFLLWFAGGWLFSVTAQADAIKPNNAFVLRSAEWAYCHPDYSYAGDDARLKPRDPRTSQLACFMVQPEAQSYPRFNPWVYSADTLLPVVNLELQEYWIPNEAAASPLGKWARWFLWAQIALGWALSLLAVAGFSGLIKTDNT